MATSQSWRREAVCLLLSLALGAWAASAYRRAPIETGDVSAPPVSRPAPAAVPAEAAATSGEPAAPPRHRRRASSDWKPVAAGFRAPGGDLGPARSLLYQLDGKALHKLAANVAAWPRSRRSQRILDEVFHRWGELDPQAALTQAQALPADLAFAAARAVLEGYAEGDPAGACAFLAAPPDAGTKGVLHSDWTRSLCLGQALESWAEKDAAAAAGFAGRLPSGVCRLYVLDDIARDWMRQDPAAALDWAQSLGVPSQRANALDGIVTTWAQTDPAAAANYVLGLSGSPDQNGLLKTLAGRWAEQDPTAAARWVTQQSGSPQTKAAAAVAETWANLDPQAAANWSSQFPAGDLRDAAWGAIAKSWYISDPAATQYWLNSLPVGSGHDAAIVGATEYWSLRNQPAETLGLVEGISDPQVRANILVSVLNSWLDRDGSAARQWISQANLPAAVTAKLNKG